MTRVTCTLVTIVLIHVTHVSNDPARHVTSETERLTTPEQELLAKYFLSRLLDTSRQEEKKANAHKVGQRRQDQDSAPSIVYPQVSAQSITQPLRKLLEKAKNNIDVIDFTKHSTEYQHGEEHIRRVRMPDASYFPQASRVNSISEAERPKRSRVSPSEAIPTFLPFPRQGTASGQEPQGCVDCVGEGRATHSRFSMPLAKLGKKNYYLGIFFKANWYKAEQYCRFHGMHLASVNSADEQRELEDHIQSFGMGHEHFWTSGTDQAEEGKFFWMSTGKPVTYENWNAGEPNNFQYENGEQEHCLELWNRDGKGLRWNDTPCSFETFFVCEV